MSAQMEAKMEVLEDITKMVTDKGESGMAAFAMGLHATMSIEMFITKLEEKLGSFDGLLSALEAGNFTDENGTPLSDTLTYQNLKKRLIKEEKDA